MSEKPVKSPGSIAITPKSYLGAFGYQLMRSYRGCLTLNALNLKERQPMRKSLIVGLLMGLSFSVFSPVATAQTRCETLKSEIQEMLGQEYAGKGKAAALEYSKRIVKAYELGFKNRNCLTPQEYEGLITGVIQLQDDCTAAKRKKSKWKQFSSRCNLYKALYKYSNTNSV